MIEQEKLNPLKMKVIINRNSHPLTYLIRAKRFNVIREYVEAYNPESITVAMIIELLTSINPGNQSHVSLLGWVIKRAGPEIISD